VQGKRATYSSVPFEGIDPGVSPEYIDVLSLDAALARLSSHYPRQAQLVELRFFGGLTGEEIAAVLDIAPITVKRDWALARAWLFRDMNRQVG
jgi:DNA-directed RNA polymerase specialized sigma24 family protein